MHPSEPITDVRLQVNQVFFSTYAKWIEGEGEREQINEAFSEKRAQNVRAQSIDSVTDCFSTKKMERDTGLEPVTYSLGSCRSTR